MNIISQGGEVGATFGGISNPTDLDAVRDAIAAGTRPDDLVSLDLAHLEIGPGITRDIVGRLTSMLEGDPGTSRVLLLCDATEIVVQGERLKGRVLDELKQAFKVHQHVMGQDGHLKLDGATVAEAVAVARPFDALVAVGSGTICDLAKLATTEDDARPLIVVQTAASVDGFTDNVSVVLQSGAKRTVPSRWPTAVIADTDVIAEAPLVLNRSGFGELMSLFTAPMDWWLAHRLGFDDTFHATPRDLLTTFVGDPRDWASGLTNGERSSVEELTAGLAIRGIGTGIAGTTACLSGAEHVVSHMLDMRAIATGQQVGLHGSQVGAASLIGAVAWQEFDRRMEAGNPEGSAPEVADAQRRVHAAFDVIDPSGKLGAECWSAYRAKLDALDIGVVREFLSSWRDIRSEMVSPDSSMIAESLVLAGAPVVAEDLEEWIDSDVWEWAVANCHLMRDRFSIVDLLSLLGWWQADDVRRVINLARQAAGAAA